MCVRSPSSNEKRGFVLGNRSLSKQSAGNSTYSSAHFEFFAVSFFLIDLQYRRNPAAVTGRYSTFKEFYILDSIRIKYGEKAKEMRRIKNGGFIQQNKILICSPTPDIKARRSFSGISDPR